MAQITVYSTVTCPYCKMLKDYLTEKGLEFTEKLVDQDDAAMAEMSKNSGGFMGVPFTSIVKEDGAKETVIGFDKTRINSILGITEN
jgi:glutaredoxin